ncbi:MAG: hypothetical protein R8G01_05925 [Ilumatobacteraceae bacterium]|nr:hypothetical protein [Ilumatobacteraceae bacterium]
MYAERSFELRRPRARAVVTIEGRPASGSWDDLWDLYFDTFEPLQELALLNHLYARADFEALLDDERVSKLIAWHEGKPVGLAMITNELGLVPQISPPFLHAKYPEQAARKAVFFGIMMFVAESHRRSTTFARLVASMGQMTAAAGGVAVFDICRHNLTALELDQQLASISRWFPDSSFEKIDEQSYFAATLPSPPERRLPIAPLPETAADGHPAPSLTRVPETTGVG